MNRALDLREAGAATVKLLRLTAAHKRHDRRLTHDDVTERLAHRDRILDALAMIQRHGADVERWPRPVTIDELATSPVQALLGALEQHPRTRVATLDPPSFILTRTRDNPITDAWRHLNRAILISAHDWSTSPQPLPRAVRWGLIADVAAISQAISTLDSQLATDLHAGQFARRQRNALSYLLYRARTGPLRPAARGALDVALAQPRADQWRPMPTVDRTHLTPVHRDDLAPAIAHLAQLLHTDLNLSSCDALGLTRYHARTSIILGRALEDGPDHGIATILVGHGKTLIKAIRAAHQRIQSIIPEPDRVPAGLAHDIHTAVTEITRAGHEADIAHTARTFIEHVGDVTRGIAHQFTGARLSHRWIMIDLEADKFRLLQPDDLPETITLLNEAKNQVDGLSASKLPKETCLVLHPHAAHAQLLALHRWPAGSTPDTPLPGLRHPRHPQISLEPRTPAADVTPDLGL